MYFVTSKLSFEGIHSWPNAPDRVKFLRDPHRHTFTVLAKKEVNHDDRDKEFICMAHDILAFIVSCYDRDDNIFQLGHTSCEMLARNICTAFDCIEVEVYEDMENSGGWVA